jgi:hypothetical protein
MTSLAGLCASTLLLSICKVVSKEVGELNSSPLAKLITDVTLSIAQLHGWPPTM